jgi:hypothetical protein
MSINKKRPYNRKNTPKNAENTIVPAVSLSKDTAKTNTQNTQQMKEPQKSLTPKAYAVARLQEIADYLADNRQSFPEAGGWHLQINRILATSGNTIQSSGGAKFEISKNQILPNVKKKQSLNRGVADKPKTAQPTVAKAVTKEGKGGGIMANLKQSVGVEKVIEADVQALLDKFSLEQLLAYAKQGNPEIAEGLSAEVYAKAIVELRQKGLLD